MSNGQQTAPVPVTMCRTTEREIWVWITNVLLVIALILFVAVGINYITHIPMGLCVIGMCYVTTIILFFLGGLKAFVVVGADYHHMVLVNRIFGYERPKNDVEALTFGKSRTLEEVTSGLHGKRPWQGVTCFDLRRRALMGTIVVTYSSDQIEQTVKWDGIIGPLPGFLCHTARNTPNASHSIIQIKTEAGLCEMVNQLTVKQLDRQKLDLKHAFENLYGYENTASLLEQMLGVYVRQLTMGETRRSKGFQKSAELPARTAKTALAMKRLLNASIVDGRPTLSGERALQTIMAESGDGELIMYQGLEGVAGGKLMLPVRDGRNKKKDEGEENE